MIPTVSRSPPRSHARKTDHQFAGIRQDEVLYKIAERVKSECLFITPDQKASCSHTPRVDFAAIYLCDLDEVPDFSSMYELYDPMTIMFFYRNKHMMCDFGTGNNNKLNWVLEDKQELIDIIETIYKGAKKGRGLVVSPKARPLPEDRDISDVQRTSRLS
ncbi:mRNA splicing factor thioredoxin-like U5 snRNP [Penicillium canariense]|uniref:mRNA splicing factor thioredoxin-like U5 snRNP n=1 Tax=Penicillium canariense TaxID=189055 RepID=A0A9W9IDS7_9EURO|nr:mRNA splicing factor thioredoxin-like U5 snRNP [Penicillium canariense]KAJ5174477.1 mRNA splicing factor thioredoxin-like U5 snRNP [Penicillium canariense]